MNIAICGLISNHYYLFRSLAEYLRRNGHIVFYIEPDYSGGVCLFHNHESYMSSHRYKQKGITQLPSIDAAIQYDLAKIDYETKDEKERERKKYRLSKDAGRKALFYQSTFRRNHIELVLVWGGVAIDTGVALTVAHSIGIETIVFEKGLFPYTLQIDTAGVNARNSQKIQLNINQPTAVSSPISLKQYRDMVCQSWTFHHALTTIPKYRKIFYLLYEHQYLEVINRFMDKIYFHKKENTFSYKQEYQLTDPGEQESEQSLPEKFIFIPMQVEDDSQLLLNATWIRNNESLIAAVFRALENTKQSIPVVIKPHPSEYRRTDYVQLQRKYPRLIFSRAGTIELIKKSSLIITINSTVGFEGLIFQKPVIVLGKALYSEIDMIERADNDVDLANKILNSLGKVLPETKVKQLVNQCYALHVACDFVDPSISQVEHLWKRIQLLLKQAI